MKYMIREIIPLVIAFIVGIAGLTQFFHEEALACVQPCTTIWCTCVWHPGEGESPGEGFCASHEAPNSWCHLEPSCNVMLCSTFCNMWHSQASCEAGGDT